VLIEESRPLSRHKFFVLKDILYLNQDIRDRSERPNLHRNQLLDAQKQQQQQQQQQKRQGLAAALDTASPASAQ
jgi:hypothetical protein